MKTRTALASAAILASLLSIQTQAFEPADTNRSTAPLPPSGQRLDPAAYLGIATTPVDDTLAKQLDLPPHVGLVVNYVDPDGPAKGALEQHDILHKLDDQILVSHYQLAVLIRLRTPGTPVHLTFLRKGKPMQADVPLVSKDLPPLRDPSASFSSPHLLPPNLRFFKQDRFPSDGSPASPDEHQKMFEKLFREKFRQWSDPPDADDTSAPQPGRTSGNHVRFRVSGSDGGASTVSTSDNEHTLTVNASSEGRHLTAVDRDGKTLYDGPINTDEELNAVPADIRKKLDGIVVSKKLNLDGINLNSLDSTRGESIRSTPSGAPPRKQNPI